MPIDPDDRPSWLPPPPRPPQWLLRCVPAGAPPRPLRRWQHADLILAAVGGALLATTFWAAPLGLVMVLASLWSGVHRIIHEHQVTEWVNERPPADQVPPDER